MILKKFTAILTAVCFLTSFAGGSFAQTAVSQDAKQSVVFDTIKPDIVAEKFGKITEFENYDSRQVIINVQDLHAHPQTQKNIASILQTLDEKYTVKTVYLEGADGKVDVSWLSLGNDPGLNKNIALQMLENGDLTGAEYFAFLNNKNNLFGLEDAEVHRRNIVRLGSIYENEEKNIRIAANVKNEINYLVNKNLAPEMKRFLKAASAYHENKMEAAKYYGILLNYADKINGSPLNYENAFNVDPEEFTEIQKVVFIDELSKKLNSKRVNAELQQYLSSLKDILSVSQYYALLEATDNLNDIDMFFKYVSSYDLGKKEGSQLKAFIKLKELNSQINPLDLFKQEQKLEELVRRALSSSDLETETAFLNDFYSYFEGYLTNKLTAKDEEYFKTNFKTFSALYGKYASVNHISEIKNQFAFLDDYYNTNNKRNEIFIQKITENDKLVSGNARLPQSPENMLNNAKEIIVIVTGGYHTRGVSEILDAKKISHITITPKISEGTSLSDINYRQIILDQSRIYKEALAFVIASQTTDVVRFLNSIKAGVAYLSKDATFDDIDALMGEINGVSAGAALVRPDNDNAEITFQNGAKIFLSRGADNKIVVDTKKSTPAENVSEDAVKISDKTVIDAYFGLAKTLVPEAFKSLYSVAVLDIKSEPIYQAAKEFFAAQVKDGADFDVDGAIPALEEYASYRAESDGQTTDQVKASLLVDGIDYESLSRMPEFFQKEALERQINKDISDSKTPAKQQSVLRTILTGLKMLVPMLFFFVAVLVSACDSRPSQQSGKQQTDISVSASDKKVPAQVVDYVAKSEVAARRFIVTNKDGQLIDYTIKGVCYSRDLNGREFYNNYKKDIELMQSLGVNSIRTYRPLAAYTVGGALDVKGTREMLDAFQKAGITVTVGFSYEDMIINGLMGLYLDAFGDHPAIVMFAMGNEYNYHEEWFSKAAWLDRLTNGIRRAKEVAPNKVIAVVHGEIPSVQEVEEFQEAGVDIVLLNIYRGPSFTDLFDQLKDLIAKTGMRFGLGECGKGSKGANGEDMFELQADFLESQLKEIQEAVEQGVIVGFYIFELRDEGWKEGFSEIIGDEAHIGLFDNDGNPKPVVAVIIKMLSGKFLSFFITEMPNVVESASAEGQEAQKKETQPSITKEQIIKTEKVVKMYENERKDDKEEPNWRAYALPLGMISIDEQGALVLEIETINAAPNSTMRIEIRNLDENGAPILNPNVLLKDSYDLAEKGGSVTVKIPGSHFSRLDLNKPIQVVISVGEVFEGKDLNTEDAVIDITYAAVALAKSTESAESSKSAPLELPFFAYILNKLGITKQKFPKIRTAIIVGLETTLIILLPPKVFSMLHGKNVQSVTEARTAAVQKMKREAIERMSRPMVNGLVYITVAGVVGGILYGLISFGIGISLALSLMIVLVSTAITVVLTVPLLAVGVGISGISHIARTHYSHNLKNLKTSLDNNVQVNVIFAAKNNLANLQEHYGTNADVNQNGTVSQNVYIVNDGINPSSEGFSNSGINVNGKTVWVKSSIADGITYYAAGVAYEEISAAIQNKKLENKVKQSLRQERIFLENTMTADYLEIDTVTENKTGTEYGQTGTARIYLGTGTEYMQTDMIYFDRVRDIRNAEGWQRARSIMIFLNKTKTIADFEKYLKILKNASNGNIIITEEFAQILAQSNKLAPVLEQLRKDGISIMVEKTADSKLPANVLNLFDGTFDPETGNIERAQAGKKGTVELNVEIISDAKTMEDSYKRTNKNVVFFETAIEEYVQSDRAGLGKFLQDITSPKILKYFAEITAEPAITDKSAAETARNFNIEKVLDDFPDLTAGDIKAMFEALQNGVPAEEIFLLDHLNVNSAVRMYLAEIDRRVEDKTAISDIKKAYMEGLAEKLAASVAFRNAKRVYGFKNKNNEKLVGELALLKYTGSETTVADAAISDRLRNMTFLNYNNEITSIINENPEAIPAVADLMLDMIFAYAMEVKTNKKDYKQEPNLQALNAILSAA